MNRRARRGLLGLGVLLAGVLGLAPQQQQSEPSSNASAEATQNVTLRFEAIDVIVDSGPNLLAAWQVEVKAARGNARIVGIEGGEAAAFRAAPYYDPEAMQGERVIVAGLSTGADLPTGRTRVARIHVEVQGAEPEWAAVVQAAAGADGVKFAAGVSVVAAGQGEGK